MFFPIGKEIISFIPTTSTYLLFISFPIRIIHNATFHYCYQLLWLVFLLDHRVRFHINSTHLIGILPSLSYSCRGNSPTQSWTLPSRLNKLHIEQVSYIAEINLQTKKFSLVHSGVSHRMNKRRIIASKATQFMSQLDIFYRPHKKLTKKNIYLPKIITWWRGVCLFKLHYISRSFRFLCASSVSWVAFIIARIMVFSQSKYLRFG